MNLLSRAPNHPPKNYKKISSWLKTMRTGSETQRAETKQQIVLVVENKPVKCFYTSIFLQRLKYQVIMTNTAEDALTFMGLTVPLVIIANVDLPQMSGVDLLKLVKHNRRTRDVPFLIYTSNKDPRMKQTCSEIGCFAYLTYDAGLEQLYAAIQKSTEAKPRRFVRLTTYLDVIVGDSLPPGSAERHDYITAISEKGMFVSTNAPLAYGSIHPFTFFLPNAPGWVFRIEGQVLYRHLSKDIRRQPGMGVKFLKVGTQERELIRDFIKATLMEGIASE